MFKNFILFAFILLTAAGCAQNGNQPNMSVQQLRDGLAADTALVLLDVRTPEELTGTLGKIEGAVNIPVQQLEQRLDELKPYKNKKIAVICRTGRRSSAATDILLKSGYNAVNVKGGMTEYRGTEKK